VLVRRRIYLLGQAAAQLVALACAVGVLWFGAAIVNGNLTPCDPPWHQMGPEDTCVAEDDDGHPHIYTYAEWKPIIESKAIAIVIMGVVGVGGVLTWVGWSVFSAMGMRVGRQPGDLDGVE
jgi:hypothetical protein